MRYFSLLLLSVLLAACTGNADADADYDATEVPTEDDNTTATAGDPAATLDATVAAVQANGGDLTALPAATALSTIDTWMEQLDDVDGADKVTGNLETLRETLREDPINGELAGMLLLTLAEDTRQVAGTAPGVSTLIDALLAGGNKLTEGAFASSSLLDQTLAAVKAKAVDITTLSVPTATKNIDSWITELRGMDDTDEMIGELENLKTELMAPSIDGEKVSDILFSLADDTRDMAGDNKSLAVLAYALEAGGWRLEGMSE
ncbi:hypothetical protein LEM8419_02084 [Neolewinella maritima]|uniref:Uncharacterized protein n=1 Tax=Neolewinella maritima TaxID=1383882 RepID=A0ABM9B274_9BACT|nr:hypothetical protein [Neolewinella maritima]CAH1001184.1 hypothetical protein LEM8419_02084 [Neolewinella maritima]